MYGYTHAGTDEQLNTYGPAPPHLADDAVAAAQLVAESRTLLYDWYYHYPHYYG